MRINQRDTIHSSDRTDASVLPKHLKTKKKKKKKWANSRIILSAPDSTASQPTNLSLINDNNTPTAIFSQQWLPSDTFLACLNALCFFQLSFRGKIDAGQRDLRPQHGTTSGPLKHQKFTKYRERSSGRMPFPSLLFALNV